MQPDGSYERESQKGPAAQKVLLEELVFSLITRA